MSSKANKSNTVACKWLLYALVTILVFEGLLRKLLPSAVGIIIFFLKDLLCIFGVILIFNTRLNQLTTRFAAIWKKVILTFIPLILYSFFLDPPLGLFGPKQYLLYVVVALLVPVAFNAGKAEELKRFFSFVAFLLIPTTSIAILQDSLPPTHWLNLGVGGDSLIGFSAAGHLRVSSTFSFTGQYSFFLNAASVFFALNFFVKAKYKYKILHNNQTIISLILGAMLLIGAFITGGRTAVVGSGACLFVGFLLTGSKFPGWFISKGVVICVVGILTISAVRIAKPEFFAAYDERSSGSEEETHSEEVEGRVLEGFTGWSNWFFKQDIGPLILGQGLGVMSNGSDQISSYARAIRSTGFWTESDISSTLWEGGAYLGFIWYLFRFYMIFYCYRLWKSIKSKNYASGASFLLGYIIVTGLTGTLGIQPPMAIWWWMAIGSILAIKQCDLSLQQKYLVEKQANAELDHSHEIAMV